MTLEMEMEKQNRNTGFKDSFREIGPYIDLGMRFAVTIVICAAIGYWLDHKLHTIPLFLMAGFLFGAVAGFWSIYRAVYIKDKLNKKRD